MASVVPERVAPEDEYVEESPMRTTVSTVLADTKAGLMVWFVALPLCLGIALASGAPLVSGLLAGIVGGILVGMLRGLPTGVSSPGCHLISGMEFDEGKAGQRLFEVSSRCLTT